MGGVGSGHQGWARPLTSTTVRADLRREPFRTAARRAGAYVATWNRGREPIGSMIVESVAGQCDIAPTAALVMPLMLSSLTMWPVPHKTVRLQLVWRSCPIGGQRPFIQCGHCSRLALVLYLVADSWRCRRCAGVVHPSTRQGDFDRSLARLAMIRCKMGYEDWRGDGWAIPDAPGRRMRRATWQRLVEQAREEQRALWEAYDRCQGNYFRTLTRLLAASSRVPRSTARP